MPRYEEMWTVNVDLHQLEKDTLAKVYQGIKVRLTAPGGREFTLAEPPGGGTAKDLGVILRYGFREPDDDQPAET